MDPRVSICWLLELTFPERPTEQPGGMGHGAAGNMASRQSWDFLAYIAFEVQNCPTGRERQKENRTSRAAPRDPLKTRLRRQQEEKWKTQRPFPGKPRK